MRTLARAVDRAELLRRLRDVRSGSLPRWGRMSAHQMICHLSDSFRMAMGRRTVTPASGLLQRTVVQWIALYAPLQWPAGIETSPEIDQERGSGTRPGDFPADVAEAESLLELFAAVPADVVRPPHPIFGRLSAAAWLRWGYLHTDHHLRQFGA